jgi:hypothetical protein
LDSDLHGLLVETSLVEGLGIVDLIVVILRVKDGKLVSML